MNLRTITVWALYDPHTRMILSLKKFKKQIKLRNYEGCVVVKMKGHYLPPRKPMDRTSEGT